MNTQTQKIVEYKNRYFEIDDEVEGELIIMESRNNVIVDFLNNYPELWDIIYKFKSILEDKEKKEHFKNSLLWEISFINTLNVEKMISVWNYLSLCTSDCIRGKNWKYITDGRNGSKQLTEFRFKLLLKILDRRFKVQYHNVNDKSFGELEDLPQYKNEKLYREFFSKNTLRKLDVIPYYRIDQLVEDIIQFINTNYSKNGIIRYPQYQDLIYGNGDNGEKGLKGNMSFFNSSRYYNNIKPFIEGDFETTPEYGDIYHRLNGWGEYIFFEDYRIGNNEP